VRGGTGRQQGVAHLECSSRHFQDNNVRFQLFGLDSQRHKSGSFRIRELPLTQPAEHDYVGIVEAGAGDGDLLSVTSAGGFAASSVVGFAEERRRREEQPNGVPENLMAKMRPW
jgi:hypothetical protein